MDKENNLMEILKALPESKIDALTKIALILKDEPTEVESVEAEKWVSTEEAAETLGVTSATVRTYIGRGDLVGRRLSARKLVVSSDSVNKMRMAQTMF